MDPEGADGAGVVEPQQDTPPMRPLTASLEQAGGLHRLTLKGHTAVITALQMLPNGINVLSGAFPCSPADAPVSQSWPRRLCQP